MNRNKNNSYFSLHYLISKVKEKGLKYCIVAGINASISYMFIRPIIRPINKFIILPVKKVVPMRKFLWIFSLSNKSKLKSNSTRDKRILAIWDLQAVPYSIGDLLELNQAMLCLAYINNIQKVDYCFICDPEKPARIDFNGIIDSENYLYYLNALIPLVQINQKFGSFFLFDSYRNFEIFLEKNIERYLIWPSVIGYVNKLGANQWNFEFINNFFKQYGFIPYISCQKFSINWAKNFIKQNVYPKIPVIIHIRNSTNDPSRNSRTDEWIAFIKYCNDKFPVTFLLIGLKNEIDNRFRLLPNVVIVKDFNSSIEEDLALIQASVIFLGNPSGPAEMAMFSEKPYLIANYQARGIPYGSQFVFSNKNQKLIWMPETSSMLIDNFSQLFESVDIDAWQKKMNEIQYEPSKIRIR